MSQKVVMVTCYVFRRKRRRSGSGDKDETAYQIWIVLEMRLDEKTDAAPEPPSYTVLDADAAEKLGERLRDAVAEIAADRVEGSVWTTADDLSENQLVGLVADLSDLVKALAENPLQSLAITAGVPAPAASFGADVTATLVLKPVLEPIDSAVHAFEIVGIVGGLVIGLHPLVITCVKHLAHDELGSALSKAFQQLLRPAAAIAAPNADDNHDGVKVHPKVENETASGSSRRLRARPRSTNATGDSETHVPGPAKGATTPGEAITQLLNKVRHPNDERAANLASAVDPTKIKKGLQALD